MTTSELSIVKSNIRDIRDSGRPFHYLGRQNRNLRLSPLANPFPLTKRTTRAKVIAEYRVWLWSQCQNKNSAAYRLLIELANELEDKGSIELACWCKPKDCHIDIVANCIRWIIKNNLHK